MQTGYRKATDKKEIAYIKKRKRKAFRESLCFYICRLFPIKKNLISVCTFEGKGGFGCNPKYIVQELHNRNNKYKFVWFVNKDCWNKEFPNYIKKVPNTVWSRAYWLTRSQIWIDNYRKPLGTKKRKGQYYLNTWHGTVGFKSIGLWRGNAFSEMAYIVSKSDSDLVDDFIIDSDWCEEVFHKGLLFNRDFIKTGSPRCDVLFGDKTLIRRNYRMEKNITVDTHLLVYAPTFRESSKDGIRAVDAGICNIDFGRIINCLAKRFGGEWRIVLKLHPQIGDASIILEEIRQEYEVDCIDASSESDIYGLIAAADALITDYSSIAMEAGFMELPVFLYVDDLDTYMEERGGQQWIFKKNSSEPVYNNRAMMPNLNLELPFSYAKDNNELALIINEFNEQKYKDRINIFKDELKLLFDGNASKRVADLIVSKNER